MAHVKLLKDKGNRRKGEILQMDSASAASLVKRKLAELVDPNAAASAAADRKAPRRGGVIVTQVVEADDPNAKAPAGEQSDDGGADSTADDGDEAGDGDEDGDSGETSAGS